jgi:hypothetical protein
MDESESNSTYVFDCVQKYLDENGIHMPPHAFKTKMRTCYSTLLNPTLVRKAAERSNWQGAVDVIERDGINEARYTVEFLYHADTDRVHGAEIQIYIECHRDRDYMCIKVEFESYYDGDINIYGNTVGVAKFMREYAKVVDNIGGEEMLGVLDI